MNFALHNCVVLHVIVSDISLNTQLICFLREQPHSPAPYVRLDGSPGDPPCVEGKGAELEMMLLQS